MKKSLSIKLDVISIFLFYFALLYAYSALSENGNLDLALYNYDFDYFNQILALLILVYFCASLYVGKRDSVSFYFKLIHLFFPTIPTLVLFSYRSVSIEFISYFFVITALVYILVTFVEKLDLKMKVINSNLFFYLFLFFCVTLYIVVLYGSNISSILSFSISKIYELRAEVSDQQTSFFEYIHHFIAKFVLPFLLVYFRHQKKYFLMSFIFILSLSMFFLTFHRATIFFPLFAMVMYEFTGRIAKYGTSVFSISFIILVLISVFSLYDTNFNLVGDLMLRRLFFLPSELNYEYFRYFQENGHTLFWNSKLTFGLIETNYTRQAAELISDHVGMLGGHANTGYIGAAYQQLWYVGIFLYCFLIGFTLLIMNAFSRYIGSSRLVFSVFSVYLFWIINSSDILPIFLTHGLLMGMLFFYLLLYTIKKGIDTTTTANRDNFIVKAQTSKYLTADK